MNEFKFSLTTILDSNLEVWRHYGKQELDECDSYCYI